MKIHISAILTTALILASLTGCSNTTEISGESNSESGLSSETSSGESDFFGSSEEQSSAVSSVNLWKDFECGTVILKYTGTEENVVIPEGVIQIRENAFMDCSSIKSIVIPSPIDKLEYSVFYGCSSLEKVEISDNIREIGAYAFAKCSSLEEIVLPKNLSAIDYSAFSGCTSLKSIAIPEGVSKIGNDAFCSCTSLENVTIPDSVTEIGCDIFCGCEKLQAEYKGKTYSFAERFDLYKAIDSNYDETVPAHR